MTTLIEQAFDELDAEAKTWLQLLRLDAESMPLPDLKVLHPAKGRHTEAFSAAERNQFIDKVLVS